MQRFLGYSLLAIAAVVGALGLVFAVAAGGYEAQAVRASGIVFIALAAVVGFAGALILRSRR